MNTIQNLPQFASNQIWSACGVDSEFEFEEMALATVFVG